MKICRFDDDRLGVLIEDQVFDVSAAQDLIRSAAPYAMFGDPVIAALPDWQDRLGGLAAKGAAQSLSSVRLLPPVARPSKLMAAPANYRAHVDEMVDRETSTADQLQVIEKAGIFLKANSSLAGPGDKIPLRFKDRLNEHEVELVVIIGRGGSNIKQGDALDHVAGYCLGLDMTVRGSEDRSFRKSIDGYSPVGPWMVTADEIADPDNIALQLEVNGKIRQQTSTNDMIFGVRKLIEFASSFYTLHPGDYFFTGTPQGVGPVKPGDIVVASSPLLGTLKVEIGMHDPY